MTFKFNDYLRLTTDVQASDGQILAAAIMHAGDAVAHAIRNLGFRDTGGPGPLEALGMALGGEGTPGHSSVAGGLSEVAKAIGDLAEAVEGKD